MRIEESARRHGFNDAQIWHAIDNMIASGTQEYDGDERALFIGAEPSGKLLEIVAILDDDPRVIHAMILQPKNYKYLTGGTR